jgi:hypothetical protein
MVGHDEIPESKVAAVRRRVMSFAIAVFCARPGVGYATARRLESVGHRVAMI